MAKITHALQKVKNSCDYGISGKNTLAAADKVKHEYRDRALGPVQTIFLFLKITPSCPIQSSFAN